MSDKKTWGTTVLGWFVEKNAQDGAAAIEASPPPDAQQPAEDLPPAAFFQSEPPVAKGGNVDYDGVFDAAGISAEERDQVSKAAGMLKTLPSAEDAVKRQIVAASLKAFGIPIEKIIETSAHEIQALEGYIRNGAAETQKKSDDSERKIQQFQQEVERIRAAMQQTVEEQKQVMEACNAKKLEVQSILEFFGQEAVAGVVRDSPRLHDPSQTKS
jgi:hypothetical protein